MVVCSVHRACQPSSHFILHFIDHSEYFDPLKVVLPGSEEEIVHAVMTAASRKQQVRVVGSGHSRNALAQSDHVILSLEHYKGAVSMDKQAQQVCDACDPGSSHADPERNGITQ